MELSLRLFVGLIFVPFLFAQPKGYNYDEAKVPRYELPDSLTMQDGAPVKSAKDWMEKRRPEVLE